MAPKRKSTTTGASKEGRTKTRHDARFVDSHAENRYHTDFSTRTIIKGRVIDYTALAGLRFDEIFEPLGWRWMTETSQYIYPRLVREFYANLRFTNSTRTIISRVGGQNFSIADSELAAILRLPDEGPRVYESKGRLPDGVLTYIESVRALVGDDTLDGEPRLSGRNLPLRTKVLHSMITYMFLPRSGHRDAVSTMDVFMLDRMTRGLRFRLAYTIMRHMHHFSTLRTASLPYGMLLTPVFRHFGVDVAAETEVETLMQHDIYDVTALKKMYIVRREGQWQFREGMEPKPVFGDDEDSDDAPAPARRSPAAAPAPDQTEGADPEDAVDADIPGPSSSSASRVDYETLVRRMDSLQTTVGDLQTTVHGLQTSVSDIQSSVQLMQTSYIQQLEEERTLRQEQRAQMIEMQQSFSSLQATLQSYLTAVPPPFVPSRSEPPSDPSSDPPSQSPTF